MTSTLQPTASTLALPAIGDDIGKSFFRAGPVP
jgi:hypothetical protein